MASGSVFATEILLVKECFIMKDGSKQDKSYGLGRVVFHRTEPAVAEQAVPV